MSLWLEQSQSQECVMFCPCLISLGTTLQNTELDLYRFFFLTLLWTRRSSRSNLILMSCQLHRVTSGQSNSGHKQIHISKLFPRIYQPSVKSIYETNHLANTNIHTQTSDTNFWRVSPFNITPVKRAHKARRCWYRRPFRLIYRYQVKDMQVEGVTIHIQVEGVTILIQVGVTFLIQLYCQMSIQLH